MRKLSIITILIVLGCSQPPASMFKAYYEHQDLVKVNCLTCHSYYLEIEDRMALRDMYPIYQYRPLKRYMRQQFYFRKNSQSVKAHQKINLAQPTIDSITAYLITMHQGCTFN
jgi:hypothetical protein